MKTALTLLIAMATLWGQAADSRRRDLPFLASSSSSVLVSWGKSTNGLRVGISCKTATTDSLELPKIFFYVANDGAREIKGVVQSTAKCVVTVNGRHYAQVDFGGPTSWMPPGRKYGPIPIDTKKLRQIPDLEAFRGLRVSESALRPELQKGTNTLSVHYRLGTNLVESGEIQVVAK